jgi:hypothetical protein
VNVPVTDYARRSALRDSGVAELEGEPGEWRLFAAEQPAG